MKAYYYSDLLCKESKWSKVKSSAFINVIYLLISIQDLLGLFVQYMMLTWFSALRPVKGGNVHSVPSGYDHYWPSALRTLKAIQRVLFYRGFSSGEELHLYLKIIKCQ